MIKDIFNYSQSRLTFGNKIWYNIINQNRSKLANSYYEANGRMSAFCGRGGKAERIFRLLS